MKRRKKKMTAESILTDSSHEGLFPPGRFDVPKEVELEVGHAFVPDRPGRFVVTVVPAPPFPPELEVVRAERLAVERERTAMVSRSLPPRVLEVGSLVVFQDPDKGPLPAVVRAVTGGSFVTLAARPGTANVRDELHTNVPQGSGPGCWRWP